MVKLSEKGVSYMAGFFMLVAFGIGGTILGGIIAIPVVAVMSGKSIAFITQNLQLLAGDANYLREMQVLQAISALMGFFVPTLFAASRLSNKPLQLTGLKGIITAKQVVLALLIIVTALALSSALGYFTYKLPIPVNWRIMFDQMERDYAENVSGIVSVDSVGNLLITLLVLAFIPALCEETFFRGGLQNYLYRGTGKFWISIIVVSIIFSAVHFSVYGFLSRAVLGIVLGLLYQYSGRLWLSIMAHFINNAAAVIMIYVEQGKGKPLHEVLADKDGSYWGFIAIPIIIFLLIQYKRNASSTTTTITDGV